MDFYYALFQQIENEVCVLFPDLGIPEIKGETWDEAYENAIVELSEWLAQSESNHISEPSTYEEVRQKNQHLGEIIPVPIDKEIVKHQQKTRRFTVIFPENLLQKVDIYRERKGKRRSVLLADAVAEYMKNHR